MLNTRDHDSARDNLSHRLQSARAITPDLMSDVIGATCTRLPQLNQSGLVAARINRLMQSSAWVDACLALIEVELPGWTLRRLAYDDGEWHCAFSNQPNLPVELDDTVDTSHHDLPLALLSAFVAARLNRASAPAATAPMPQAEPAAAHVVCCDNFA
jgi:hypothetical protein